MRVCRGRHYCASLLLLLLSSLAIIYTAQRSTGRRGWQAVISDTMRGPRSNDIQQISHREVSLATHTPLGNAQTFSRDMTHASDGGDMAQALELNGGALVRGQRENHEPLLNHTIHTLISRAVGDGGEGGEGERREPPAVWRGRYATYRDPGRRKLQQMFPLGHNFSFPNPQVSTVFIGEQLVTLERKYLCVFSLTSFTLTHTPNTCNDTHSHTLTYYPHHPHHPHYPHHPHPSPHPPPDHTPSLGH